jgi:hypothetical protein
MRCYMDKRTHSSKRAHSSKRTHSSMRTHSSKRTHSSNRTHSIKTTHSSKRTHSSTRKHASTIVSSASDNVLCTHAHTGEGSFRQFVWRRRVVCFPQGLSHSAPPLRVHTHTHTLTLTHTHTRPVLVLSRKPAYKQHCSRSHSSTP